MGGSKKGKKKYDTPPHPWQQVRMEDEGSLIEEYGLKNKRELWKAESELRKFRKEARRLLAELGKTGERSDEAEEQKEEFLDKLKKNGLLGKDSTLDDVLALDVRRVLDRRLQTQVYKKGFANTIKQARQFVVHGHIAIDGNRIDIPGYRVEREEEQLIEYSYSSPLNEDAHPERPERVKEES